MTPAQFGLLLEATKIVVGVVYPDLSVEGFVTQSGSGVGHESLKWDQPKTDDAYCWRYNKLNGNLYWWGSPSLEQETAVHDWLRRKHGFVADDINLSLTRNADYYADAH